MDSWTLKVRVWLWEQPPFAPSSPPCCVKLLRSALLQGGAVHPKVSHGPQALAVGLAENFVTESHGTSCSIERSQFSLNTLGTRLQSFLIGVQPWADNHMRVLVRGIARHSCGVTELREKPSYERSLSMRSTGSTRRTGDVEALHRSSKACRAGMAQAGACDLRWVSRHHPLSNRRLLRRCIDFKLATHFAGRVGQKVSS